MLRKLFDSEESQEFQQPFQACCASFSHAVAAPFQRLLCTHIGHILAFQKQLHYQVGSDLKDFAASCPKIQPCDLAFLLSVEGLVLFLTRGPFISLLLVSMEKEKEGPMEMEMLKA